MNSPHLTMDDKAKRFACCAQEFQTEMLNASKNFKSLTLLKSAVNHAKNQPKSTGILTFFASSLNVFNPWAWGAPPSEDIFKDITDLANASKEITSLISQELLIEGVPDIENLLSFFDILEQRIYCYIATVSDAIHLLDDFKNLPTDQKDIINQLAQNLKLNLDGIHGGILIQLIQHVCRIPLFFKTLQDYAQASTYEPIHLLTDRISILECGTTELVATINKSKTVTPKN